MYYFLLLTFFSLILYIVIGDMPKSAWKTNPKYRKHILDVIVCFLGGLFFAVSVNMFVADRFYIGSDLLNSYDWRFGRANNSGPFIFGYIITYIIIFVKRAYKK